MEGILRVKGAHATGTSKLGEIKQEEKLVFFEKVN